jgi:nicotinate dehydrogenase subunit A
MAEKGLPAPKIAEPTPPQSPDRRGLITGGVGAALALVGGAALLEACEAPGSSSGLKITVNGKAHSVQASPDTPLLYVLRNEVGLKGPRYGCGFSECGACTVQLDGKPVRSCVTKVSVASGRAVTTLEGLGSLAKPHPLQKAFIAQQAAQCGYCISGMIMEADALLRTKPKPSTVEIKTALNGHLCRCGTHYRIVRAVQVAAGTPASAGTFGA